MYCTNTTELSGGEKMKNLKNKKPNLLELGFKGTPYKFYTHTVQMCIILFTGELYG